MHTRMYTFRKCTVPYELLSYRCDKIYRFWSKKEKKIKKILTRFSFNCNCNYHSNYKFLKINLNKKFVTEFTNGSQIHLFILNIFGNNNLID